MLINRITNQIFRVISSINHFSKMSSDIDKYHATIVKFFIPKLSPELHKGQCGRVGVIGGSVEYTGAPYFSSIAAMKLGADLVYVFCCRDASTVIKSYSPELIVLPVLDDANCVELIKPWLDRLHVLLIGPGLGRDEDVLRSVESLIEYCNTRPAPLLPLVIDADALFLVTRNPDLLKKYNGPVIITPNGMEFQRLCDQLDIHNPLTVARDLGVVVVNKGSTDTISNGLDKGLLNLTPEDVVMTCDVPGSFRRCGGQGDILAGCIAVFVAWFHLKLYINGHIEYAIDVQTARTNNCLNIYRDRYHGFSLASYAACIVARRCSYSAFAKYGRSMTATNLIEFIHATFEDHFEHS